MNPFKSLEKKIKQGINSLGNDVKSGVNSLGDEVKGSINSVGNEVKKGIESQAKKAISEIDDRGRVVLGKAEDVAKNLGSEIESATKDAFDALARSVSRQGLRKCRSAIVAIKKELDSVKKSDSDLIGYVDQLGFKLKLGPATLKYTYFYTRAQGLVTVLDEAISKPPSFRCGPIMDLITALGPDTIDLGISAELSFIVGSNELGFGFEAPAIPVALFTELGTKVLVSIGVPE